MRLRPGDFVQTTAHVSDVYFQVKEAYGHGSDLYVIYYTYDRNSSQPRTESFIGTDNIRHVIYADMAVPVMIRKRNRFKAAFGKYDPFSGFTPAAFHQAKLTHIS